MSSTFKLKQKFKQIWQESQTVLLSKLQAIGAALSAAIYGMNQMAMTPEFKNFLSTIPDVPWQVPTTLALLAVLTYVAHAHKDE